MDLQLTEIDYALFVALKREGQAPARYLQGAVDLKTAAINKRLRLLQDKGMVLPVFNAFGPQDSPWWYQCAPKAPTDFVADELTKGLIYDWGMPQNRLWVETRGRVNEWGVPLAYVRAGTHNSLSTAVPAHMFGRALQLRERGEVTDFSSRFSCDCHGECTAEMVRTDKTCSLCSTPLIRHSNTPYYV